MRAPMSHGWTGDDGGPAGKPAFIFCTACCMNGCFKVRPLFSPSRAAHSSPGNTGHALLLLNTEKLDVKGLTCRHVLLCDCTASSVWNAVMLLFSYLLLVHYLLAVFYMWQQTGAAPELWNQPWSAILWLWINHMEITLSLRFQASDSRVRSSMSVLLILWHSLIQSF